MRTDNILSIIRLLIDATRLGSIAWTSETTFSIVNGTQLVLVGVKYVFAFFTLKPPINPVQTPIRFNYVCCLDSMLGLLVERKALTFCLNSCRWPFPVAHTTMGVIP
jgi:hypothetical protein